MRGYPYDCPKCGEDIAGEWSRVQPETDAPRHFQRNHPLSVFTAYWRDSAMPCQFAYIGPVSGLTTVTWYVISFDFPYDLIKIRPAEWRIVWYARTGPGKEGAIA